MYVRRDEEVVREREKEREREKQSKYVKMKMDKEHGANENKKKKRKAQFIRKSKLYSEVVVLVENVSQVDRTNNLTNVRYSN